MVKKIRGQLGDIAKILAVASVPVAMKSQSTDPSTTLETDPTKKKDIQKEPKDESDVYRLDGDALDPNKTSSHFKPGFHFSIVLY